ncbi:pyrroline-5-carboxylate reductase [Curvibacter sp. HBC61]|uniref:Pyrroline-5-carboxylate reductase n=1 Tax=Curvibacter cyanobacteriorum TaxID=3026422 RepID=A0ABT5N3N2_9BURK|nr:pyrroline-5-carboxylate reductase [Curvibacter sp. HBC61]MDD0840251.1 pyrroline-5-carboxylate reductase [Curvibacter sp. HBC61]
MTTKIAFIGGGNMASAIIGGLLKQGLNSADILVVEPFAEARERLTRELGVQAMEAADRRLADARLVVWAVKPQTFRDAAAAVQAHTGSALHLSVAAGIRSDSIAQWLGSERVVRCMPNTPALVGKGMTGLFARAAVTAADREQVEQVIRTTGDLLWVAEESQLDAVTALSGSGPAYVFYFIEAMTAAGAQMGLSPAQAQQLAIGTFVGAADLARASSEPPEVLRQRVTSKGGTTYAALTSMEDSRIKEHFIVAMEKARVRAQELGDEFGAP